MRGGAVDFDLETAGELDSVARIARVPLDVEAATGAAIRVGFVSERLAWIDFDGYLRRAENGRAYLPPNR